MDRRWKKGEIELRYDADEGSFSAWYFETSPADRTPERYREILRNLVKEAGAEADTAGKTHPDLASRAKGCVLPIARKRPRSRPN